MSMVSDFEVINSALMYGEPGVSMKLIERKLMELRRLKRISDSNGHRFDSHISMLELYSQVIKGKLTVEDFSRRFKEIKDIQPKLEIDDLDFAVETISYYLQLSMDRYSIRYPEYDSKRCDDL
jgi:hypothetical protein